jgi:ribonuclease P protein component
MDRLRQRADFLAVADGPRMNSAAFVVQSRARGDAGPVRIGFTVSMRPHNDYVLVGRRAALTRDFATMLDDLRSALHRLDRQPQNARRPQAATRIE